MTSKRFFARMVSGVALCSALGAGAQTPSATETNLAPVQDAAALPAPAKLEPGAERPLFITLPPLFDSLKRAPVKFWHDKHTAALKTEGCAACHPKTDDRLDFAFPKERDESSRDALMTSYHDACIGCHTQRANERKKAGPVTCGECHIEDQAYHPKAYEPILPEYYAALRDTYHQDCLACHRKPEKTAHDAGALNWKGFYVKEKTRIELAWPPIVYDYVIHDKHVKTLEKKCELCHYLSPATKQKLAAEGKEPTSQDWLREEEEGKSLKEKASAHLRCLTCHLERQAEKKTHGPLDCKECHVDRLRAPREMAQIPVPDYDKKERLLIQAEKTGMAAVPFDHKAHIAASRSCDDCHHDTLESCKKCHTLKGAKEGKFITLADAYHQSGSTWSCVGCHAQEKEKPDCAGCHHLQPERLTSCGVCHTGKLESLDQVAKLPAPATLFPTNLTDELEIAILAKEYETSKVKHKDIAQKLTEISNSNKLATAFHKEETTICAGCHHTGHVEKGKPVPSCAACHTVQNEPTGERPTLLGAYHQQCLGCHKHMGRPEDKMPQQCTGCHKEKKQPVATGRE